MTKAQILLTMVSRYTLTERLIMYYDENGYDIRVRDSEEYLSRITPELLEAARECGFTLLTPSAIIGAVTG